LCYTCAMRNETLEDLILARGNGLKRTAEAASIGRTSIWRWTRGLAFPRHAQAAALAAVLGVDAERVLVAASASQQHAANG
jgi:transcriptional regulator with XRE-family HTH domain